MSQASCSSPDPYGANTKWSFARAARFRPLRPRHSADFIAASSSFSRSHSPGMGYGKRWQPRNPTGVDAPPGSYLTKSCFDLMNPGPGFGKPGKYSDRFYLPPSKTPGPGQYLLDKCLGEGAPKFTMKARHEMPRKADTPPPGQYSPNTSLTWDSRFAAVGFGYGGRQFLTKMSTAHADKNVPGPGAYNLPSSFHQRSPSMPTPKLPSIRAKAER